MRALTYCETAPRRRPLLSASGEGLLAIGAAVALYALFSLPARACVTGDGILFQLLMCLGVFLVGVVVLLAQCAAESACPELSPLAMLGGGIWCISNVLLVPIVKCIGVGRAMLTWGLWECIAGWATGRFGLFGLRVEDPRDPVLNFVGVGLVLLALAVVSFAADAESGPAVQAMLLSDEADAEATALLHSKPSAGGSAAVLAALLKAPDEAGDAHFNEHGYDPTASLSPPLKRAFGLCACVVAGCLSGSTFTPPQLVVDRAAEQGMALDLFDLIFSHYSGILLTSTTIFAIYCVATRNRPWASNAAMIGPALLSGMCWGLAGAAWFVANARLSIVIALPIITVGPGILTLLIGGLFFGEVRGVRQISLLSVAVVIFISAAVCITLSGAQS